MKKWKAVVIAAVALAAIATAARADWYPGEPYKMVKVQMPDPFGWDIEIFSPQHEVADDWQCSQSGAVSDIHFWTSWPRDEVGVIQWLSVAIYSNVVAGSVPFSQPGTPLWGRTFQQGEFRVIDPYGQGDQGFADPQQREWIGWGAHDHQMYQQINITDIVRPFPQKEGEIYWLGIYAGWEGITQPPVGWKTSLDHFMDVAVYKDLETGAWTPLIDRAGNGLDMAFVITPEPATLALMGLGVAGLVARRRNRS